VSSKTQLIDLLRHPMWRQRIPLDDQGMTTAGYLSLPNEWEFNYLPERLDGKSFMDVGANDGYFAFAAEKRGASEMVAADIYYEGENSNRFGWNIKGAQLLKDYFQSNVELQTRSIFDLKDMNRQFDVVLCTDVISWLDNINEAIAQLCSACKGTLYLKDGFLDRFDPEPVMQYEKGKKLVTFRVNLSYIKEVLKQNGFEKVEIKPIYSFKYFDWQSSFPKAANNSNVSIFEEPNGQSNARQDGIKDRWILSEYNGFYFIRGRGWVKKEDVQVAPRLQSSMLGKIAKSVMNDDMRNDFVRKRGSEKYVKSYMVIASR
jgi:SAM-dependent methyltransferase